MDSLPMTAGFQRSFAAGEIGPEVYAGADFERFNAALRTCRNFFVQRHGGVANRPGSQFVAEVKDSSVRTYLIEFVYNDAEAYILEAGAAYFRFYRLGAPVTVSGAPAYNGATAYGIGDVVSSGGVNYYCIAAHTGQAPPNATYWYAMPGAIFEIPTPYLATDLADIQYVQSADVMTLVHRNYPPMELRRYSNRWTLTAVTTSPSMAAPTGLAATPGAAGSLPYAYVVTAAAAESFEESIASAPAAATGAAPDAATPNVLTWTAVPGAAEYYVYLDKAGNGTFGFLGTATSNAFNDIGFIPDESVGPPAERVLFAASGDYPQAVTYHQQRLMFASTANEPEKVWASRTGAFHNFTVSSPSQDDDAVSWVIAGRQESEVRHMLEVGESLVTLTSSGEWRIVGDESIGGILTPYAINPKQQAAYGSARVMPEVVGSSLIYVQARGSLVRDLRFEQEQQGYDGRDLTVYAPHLVAGFGLERMTYAQVPHSIVWVIRSDGVLLGLTYLREFDTWGWHHHDTNGVYEDVASVPEIEPAPAGAGRANAVHGKDEDFVYVIVKRVINGIARRYIERFASRQFEDYRLDGVFVDSFLTYNGINPTLSTTTVTVTTSAGWTPADTLTVTATAPVFVAGDVGNGVTLWRNDLPAPSFPGVVRITITAYVSPTVVQGHPSAAVPPELQNTAIQTWARAVDEVGGLEHLEGAAVSILANGVASSGTVTAGRVTLAGLYDVIHVGLPIEADFETLDIDDVQQVVRDRRKVFNNVSLMVNRSRGITMGPDADHLHVYAPGTGEALGSDVFDPTGGQTRSAVLEAALESTYEQPGRLFVRQSEPFPLTILGVIPHVIMGG